jgi:hypothetical protein
MPAEPAPAAAPPAATASPEDVANSLRLLPYGDQILRLFGRAAVEASGGEPMHEPAEPAPAPAPDDPAASAPAAAEPAGAPESPREQPPAAGAETAVAAGDALATMISAAQPAKPARAEPTAAAAGRAAQPGSNEFAGSSVIKDMAKDKQGTATYQGRAGWDVGSAHRVKATGGEASAAIYAVSRVEGTYDNVQTYDSGVLTFGILQWTVHAGSLQGFLGYLKNEAGPAGAAAFQDHLGSHEIDIRRAGQHYELYYQGKLHTGPADFDQLIRRDLATAGQWVGWFHALGTDPRAQKAQFDYARAQYHRVQDKQLGTKAVNDALHKCKTTFKAENPGDYGSIGGWTSASPKAALLYFSMNANNPAYANASVLKAIDAFYAEHGKDRDKWPTTWPDRFADLLEAKCRETLPTWGGANGRVSKTLKYWDDAHREGGASAAPVATSAPSATAAAHAPATHAAKPPAAVAHAAPAHDAASAPSSSSVMDYATGLADKVASRAIAAEDAALQAVHSLRSMFGAHGGPAAAPSAAHHPTTPAAAHPAVHAVEHAADHAKPAPSDAPRADHPTSGYDRDKRGVDSYGNSTVRKDSRAANAIEAHRRVFENSFTATHDAAIYNGPTEKQALPHKLPGGTRLHVGDVVNKRVQILTGTISAADHVWIDFSSLGGHGADVGFGNERADSADKQRADAIRGGLPPGRSPGAGKFQWGFGSGFLPALDGVALDGSLMGKVHALMEWAIYNDMVLGDIRIGSGMRSPRDAHQLCVRYEIARNKMKNVSMEDVQNLPDGRDHDGHQWYQPGWTQAQVIANAEAMYGKGDKGAVAAAGYDFGDPRRAPLPINSKPGVSRHCSGHAVDVDIPWRSVQDPLQKDLWGWEQIYHQFGLTRPLHRDLGGEKSKQESWHIEETGKCLEPQPDHE